MPQALHVQHLQKNYGTLRALDDVSFSVGPGEIFGFVGSNGAGKSTTMRIILGVLSADAGEVRLGDAPIDFDRRRRIGYMPEERGLYPKQPVLDQLVYLGRLQGRTTADARREATDLLDRFGLGERLTDKLESLSLGNQQRVQIAAAVIGRPDLLVLDEPFSGLDPVAVDSMVDLLREYTTRGVPVLFSSHQLDLVERLCDQLVVLSGGKLVAQGTVDDLRRRGRVLHRLVVGGDAGWVRDVPGIHVVDVDGPTALLDLGGADGSSADSTDIVLRAAMARGSLREFAEVVPTLSDIYREVTV